MAAIQYLGKTNAESAAYFQREAAEDSKLAMHCMEKGYLENAIFFQRQAAEMHKLADYRRRLFISDITP